MRSTNTSITPPQILSSPSRGLVRSTRTRRGRPSSCASSAATMTSDSPQPPPIVPQDEPSARTSMRAPARRGVDPRVAATVARTAGLPLSRDASSSRKTSFMRAYRNPEGQWRKLRRAGRAVSDPVLSRPEASRSAESYGNGFGRKSLALPDQSLELVRPDGRAHEKPLKLVAVDFPKEPELGIRLHTLGNDTQVQAPCHGHNGGDDSGVVLISCYIVDKGAIDFDGVDWKALQVTERRITGAEVVDTQTEAHLPKLGKRGNNRFHLPHYGALGKFEMEIRRRQTAFGESARNGGDQAGLLHLASGHVD